MKTKNLVGGNIRRLRRQSKLTQEELALRSGLSQGYINQLEKGTRRYTQKSLEVIVDTLNVPIIELFRDESDKNYYTVRDIENKYGGKPPDSKEVISLLSKLPSHIACHYVELMKIEIGLLKGNEKMK